MTPRNWPAASGLNRCRLYLAGRRGGSSRSEVSGSLRLEPQGHPEQHEGGQDSRRPRPSPARPAPAARKNPPVRPDAHGQSSVAQYL